MLDHVSAPPKRMPRGVLGWAVPFAVMTICLEPGSAPAQTAAPNAPAQTPPPAAAPAPTWEGDLLTRSNLLGDIGGLRTWLDQRGITFGLTETSEVLGNFSGGTRQGYDYDGLTTMSVKVDTEKAFGWSGGLLNVSALQIHGRNLSADNLASLQTASGIEANRATRLWELWYQQQFLDGKLDARVGQQSLDQEFMGSQYATLFVNTTFGWPILPASDMLGGSPAYPLSALGARLKVKPTDSLTFLGGVYNDNPAGFDKSDPQRANYSGTNFRIHDDPLFIAEAQYMVNPPPEGSTNPPGGLYRLGFWYDLGKFNDRRFDTNGVSLADPATNGIARKHRGNYALYAVMDQEVWRPDPNGSRALGVFARVIGAPDDDRNLIDLNVNAGVSLKGALPGRPDDTLGLGFGYVRVGDRAAALDRDTQRFTGVSTPVRGSEQIVELTYQIQVTPWWQIQPDFQYVFTPGAGVANPNNSPNRVEDEAIAGLRMNVTF